MMTKNLCLFVVLTGVLALHAEAAVVAISGITHTGTTDGDPVLTSLTAGSVTYSSFTPATATGVGNNTFVGTNTTVYSGGNPTPEVAVTDLILTSGENGQANSAEFQFGSLALSDVIYLFEMGGTDAMSYELVDAAGDAIAGDFELSLTGTFGTLGVFQNTAASQQLAGVTFTASDFQATSTATGISIGDFYAGSNATGFKYVTGRSRILSM
jgi:hypothetical protein